jgi:hypothetical protein
VKPMWKVPQNSKFDVQELPQILSTLPFRYVWLDLLTIPQGKDETLGPELAKRKDDEIMRQAQIFKSATRSVAWLNDVTGWRETETALRWLCARANESSFRRWRRRIFGGLDKFEAFTNLGSNGSELFEVGWDGEAIPNKWFTSLWTLQEVCLRPDMIPCDRNWRPITHSDGQALSYVEIASLCHYTISKRRF